ncbi:sensor histidine kinase [Curtobacterium sp. MCPF17_046]|uniref:sensor histidine kinase n=1 Tax=Curtobacterium sp. MCPF17_046 TaxID=2175663 RepID=UPI000D868801|nr:sensor histidine kinase [Curtobacterium sp. MCPF17_046]PYY43240.1 sensor histidine kinase [Curtobacterium sp. MCPF17_046]
MTSTDRTDPPTRTGAPPRRTGPSTGPAWTVPPWTFLLSGTPWRALLDVTLTAALGLVVVAPVVATWFLAPVWAVAVARVGRRLPVVLGLPRVPDPRSSGRVRHTTLRGRFRDPLAWSELGYLPVFLLVAGIGFALVVLTLVSVSVAVGAATGARPQDDDVVRTWLDGLRLSPPVELAGALVVLVVLLYAVTALATAHDLVARALLGDRTGELEHRVEELTDSRRALLDGFDAERRRIERDLHDGAQQQLTILSMNIGLLAVDLDAAERDGRDLGALRQALDRISGNVDDAVDALRATIRGIHPRVLVDHGLGAAVDELAARSPLAVRVAVDLPVRPPARVETAAYFVVSEALTNAGRHGAAATVQVTAGTTDDRFWLEVADDGVGGAVSSPGGGLDGLRERAAVLGGSFHVESPIGGPTVLRFSVPTHGEHLRDRPDVVRWRS